MVRNIFYSPPEIHRTWYAGWQKTDYFSGAHINCQKFLLNRFSSLKMSINWKNFATLFVPCVQQQKGDVDCGLFAIAFAVELASNNFNIDDIQIFNFDQE